MKSLLLLIVLMSALPALAGEALNYRVLIAGEDIGYLNVDHEGDALSIDFDYKQNGRGPTVTEQITIDERGYPIDWTISGTTTFGSGIDEYFRADDGVARWRDATGPGSMDYSDAPAFYIDQNGSGYANALLVRALLASADGRLPVYPGGRRQYGRQLPRPSLRKGSRSISSRTRYSDWTRRPGWYSWTAPEPILVPRAPASPWSEPATRR